MHTCIRTYMHTYVHTCWKLQHPSLHYTVPSPHQTTNEKRIEDKDPLWKGIAKCDGKDENYIDACISNLGDGCNNRLWYHVKKQIGGQESEIQATWPAAEQSKKDKQARKNSILRAWLGDQQFSERFLKETRKIRLSDEYRRLLSWKTYDRMIKDEGQDAADYKIDHNEVKMRRIKGRDGDGKMCFE